jgi:AraC family transcriptional regulator
LRTETGIEPEFRLLAEKKLIGMRLRMSFANNRTAELWRTFIPRRMEIVNRPTADLISLQVYGVGFFDDIEPSLEFEKWAAAEVADINEVPDGMEVFTIPGGLYAVFLHKGSDNDDSIFRYIFTDWLPGSGYMLDQRPHFEILGEKYKRGDLASEEEIWIPIKE